MDKQIIAGCREITWRCLRKKNSMIPVPFQVSLTDTAELLIAEKIVRIIPGKRMVVFGTWGDKEVVAKLFYAPGKASQHILRDKQGVNALVQSGILTPILLYQGASLNKKIQVLLFEKIQTVANNSNFAENKSLLQALTLELATQHVLGILQKDMHLKNFLLTADKIYMLDGSDVEKFDQPVTKELSLANLALLLAQFGVNGEQYQQEMLEVYAAARSWKLKDVDVLHLQKYFKKALKHRWDKYQKKIFRNCSAFAEQKRLLSRGMYSRQDDNAQLQQVLTHPDGIFSEPGVQFLKQGRSATVINAMLAESSVVIKRYNIKNIWHRLRRCLRSTRAAKSWRLSQYLTLMGVKTPRPIAFMENKCLGLRGKSYFVMEQVHGVHIGDYFSDPGLTDADKQRMSEKIMTLFKHLAILNLTHGDLKMTNILICDHEPVLIDLDGMTEHKCPFGFEKAFRQELDRFLRNWEHQSEVKELFNKRLNV